MSSRSILIVDDEPFIVEELVEALEYEGYRCLVADRVASAMACLDSGETVDILLSDIKMPGRSGLDLLRFTEQHETFKGHVILMSGHGTSDGEVMGSLDKDYPFLKKPICLDELLIKLEGLGS